MKLKLEKDIEAKFKEYGFYFFFFLIHVKRGGFPFKWISTSRFVL